MMRVRQRNRHARKDWMVDPSGVAHDIGDKPHFEWLANDANPSDFGLTADEQAAWREHYYSDEAIQLFTHILQNGGYRVNQWGNTISFQTYAKNPDTYERLKEYLTTAYSGSLPLDNSTIIAWDAIGPNRSQDEYPAANFIGAFSLAYLDYAPNWEDRTPEQEITDAQDEGLDYGGFFRESDDYYKSMGSYQADIRRLARSYWNGTISRSTFYQGMAREIQGHYYQAWQYGIRGTGGSESEDGLAALQDYVAEDVGAINGLADFIDTPLSLADLYGRLDLWVNRYDGIRDLARLYETPDDQLMIWVIGATDQSCKDCLDMAGQIMTAEKWREWQDMGIYPKSHNLECHGYNCQCQLKPISQSDAEALGYMGEIKVWWRAAYNGTNMRRTRKGLFDWSTHEPGGGSDWEQAFHRLPPDVQAFVVQLAAWSVNYSGISNAAYAAAQINTEVLSRWTTLDPDQSWNGISGKVQEVWDTMQGAEKNWNPRKGELSYEEETRESALIGWTPTADGGYLLDNTGVQVTLVPGGGWGVMDVDSRGFSLGGYSTAFDAVVAYNAGQVQMRSKPRRGVDEEEYEGEEEGEYEGDIANAFPAPYQPTRRFYR